MIKIKRDGNVTLLSAAVTDFSDSMGYCEYKIPLSIKCVKQKNYDFKLVRISDTGKITFE